MRASPAGVGSLTNIEQLHAMRTAAGRGCRRWHNGNFHLRPPAAWVARSGRVPYYDEHACCPICRRGRVNAVPEIKLKHWCGVSGNFGLEGAPVLELCNGPGAQAACPPNVSAGLWCDGILLSSPVNDQYPS